MWKKDEGQPSQPTTESGHRAPTRTPTSGGGARASIGPSIVIKGDVTGSEDLIIQGKVDGSVTLAKHAVSVGSEGRVHANIVARQITVEGKVEGDLTADEQIILRGSAQVHGDIKAPRVVLEDGATFRGLVDMGAVAKGSDRTESSSARGAAAGTVEAPKGSAASVAS